MNDAPRRSQGRKKSDHPLPGVAAPEPSHRQEATIINGNPCELRDFLVQHIAMPVKPHNEADATGDLFQQAVPATGADVPPGAKRYETIVLRKKKGK
jgi:hypothetical protein